MKTLLIQIRPEKTTRDHEFDCFLKKTGMMESQVVRVNSLEEMPNADHLKSVDAMVIGGSGDYLVSQGDIPQTIKSIGTIVGAARQKKLPTLGICFGAQIMAHTLGGKVELDEDNAELGTFTVKKNAAATFCPIFSDMPEAFDVQLGHKDHVTQLPKGAVNLASSERSEVQAFTFPGEPVYAFTFHPELDAQDIHWRLDYYAKYYDLTPEKVKELKESTWEAQHGIRPLQAFFEHVASGNGLYRADRTVSQPAVNMAAIEPGMA